MKHATFFILALTSVSTHAATTCFDVKKTFQEQACCSGNSQEGGEPIGVVLLENSKFNDRPRHLDTRFITVNHIKFSPFQFSKTLPHDSTTYMPTLADAALLRSASSFEAARGAIGDIQQSAANTRKIEGLYSGLHQRLRAGAPLGTLETPGYHEVDSIDGLCDMVENYWVNILASKPFNAYDTSATAVPDAMEELTKCIGLGAYKGPTPIQATNLFRGSFPGEDKGPYVSQFLTLPFSIGNTISDNKVKTYAFQKQQLSSDQWQLIQNGGNGGGVIEVGQRYIYNGASLGSAVHNDALYQMYYTGALIALQNGIKLTNQLPDMSPSSSWKEGGPPDLLYHIGAVAGGALRHSWVSKFHDHLKIRPEVMAMRMAQLTDTNYDADVRTQLQSIVKADFLSNLTQFDKTRNYASSVDQDVDADTQTISNSSSFPLLTSLFPEMSPTHPSFPAGHAVVAGACTTILKAMFVTHDSNGGALPWIATAKTSDDGLQLVDVDPSVKSHMTIVGEFNKLAQNMEFGRVFAQVHYRSDANGILLGEEYAISYLVDILSDYSTHIQRDRFPNSDETTLSPLLFLEKFDGSTVVLSRFGVVDSSSGDFEAIVASNLHFPL